MPFAATPDTMAGAGYTFAIARCDELPACGLTSHEQREYDALPHAARRRDWLAGRYAAKRAIAARWKLSTDAIELTSTSGTAPRAHALARTGRPSPLPDRLTLSHRDGVAIAAAFPSSAAVGVDLERAGGVSSRELRYFMSEAERSCLPHIDATLVWILKEAAWKALGLAPTTPFSSLQLVFRAGARTLAAVRLGTHELRARAEIRHVDASKPLMGALVEITPEAS